VTTIALATCEELPSLVDDDASFVSALRDRDVTVDPVVWSDDSVAWDRFDAVLVRSIWDYYRHPEEFAAWIDRLEAASCPVWNHPETLRWNQHKFYLRDLEERGVSTLPTAYVERGRDVELSTIVDDREWDEVVVKPAVSAGAFETRRIARGDAADEQVWFDDLLAERDVLVQQFAGGITAGEWSLVFFDGAFSHAVVKRPKAGDFRVQEDHGGSVAVESPSESLRAQANDVVDAVTAEMDGERPLYARVDGIERGESGRLDQAEPGAGVDTDFHLLEVELIEPELFFRVDDDAGPRLAEALDERL
jgi:glutathione synthase/RimK-type ligase-like ATP-grasp enzyme